MSRIQLHRVVTGTLLALAVATSAACSRTEHTQASAEEKPASPSSVPTPQAAATATPAPRPAPLVTVRREIMSTWFEAKVANVADEAKARAALEAALDEVARLETVLSEWRPETEISRINASAGGTPVSIGPDTEAVLRAGVEVATWSDGAFDPTWAAMRGLYKFDPKLPPVVPKAEDIERLRKLVGYRDLVLDTNAHTARLARPGMAVGTGGIAKGYALDRAQEILKEAGFANFLLFAGGQVQVGGKRDGRAWRVGIKHPRRGDINVGAFEIENGSISTSGDYEHYFMVGDKLYHHIIDLKTGYPADKSASVTLIHPSGVYADALSTACFVVGPKACLSLLERIPGNPQAVIIDREMRVFVSKGLEGKVWFTPPLVDGVLPPAPR